ncbi:hypothetical protein NUW58_g1075 [Xylaria curta]|uniref:Uncharacterized protein n=1 Tax=Xylaria curta TaxID=42375 RepID=A0ACC1PLS7_9PEZI|nr:hypothetical protein NUW58_g1075 [Xylaria curta]
MALDMAYEYIAVVAPRAIRLMRLYPGNKTDPIHLSLVVATLDSAPGFESISYCWGNPQDKRQVICNGASLSITNSLFTGLVHFRHADRPRMLWADAICINQADATEKSAQVLLMPHIYSRAIRTLVWLGVADDPVFGTVSPSVAGSIRQAFQLLPEFDPENAVDVAAKSQAIRHDSRRLRDEGKLSILDHDWVPLAALLARPWFRRKWVVQEVALANEVILYAGGGVEIPWFDLAKLAFSMELLGIQRLESLELERTVLAPVILPLHCVSCVFTVQLFRQRATLLDGVMVTMDFECTDPRDHVYSLLSLGGIGPVMLPDYNASICEVFTRFAIAMLVQCQSLKLLSLAPHRSALPHTEAERLEGLPSWAPDLRFMRADMLVSYTVRPQAFSAGGSSKSTVSVSDDERILRCQGRVIDTVKMLSASLMEMMLADIPELRCSSEILFDPSPERRKKRLVQWLESCHHVAFGYAETSEATATPNDELMRAFARTMVCDLDIMRNRLPPEVLTAFPEYVQWASTRAASNANDKGQPSISPPNYSASIDESLMAFASVLKFCLTENGRFSQVPISSQPGDCICVLVGGEVPLVARPTGRGTYTLVGECYLDGVMDGESFEGNGIEPETIHFE